MRAVRGICIWMAIALGCLLAGAPAASAALTLVSSGSTLTINSDAAADNITVTCVSGKIAVTGLPTTTTNCSSIDRLIVNGDDGNDSINLAGVTKAAFPALRFSIIDGGFSNSTDSVVGTEIGDTVDAFNDNVNGGPGDDVITDGLQITGGDGDDTLIDTKGPADGGPGDDLIESPDGLGPYTGGPGYDTFAYDTDIFDQQAPPVAADFTLSISDTTFGINFTSPIVQAQSVSVTTIERADLSGINGGTQTFDGSTFSGDLHADGRGGPDTLLGGSGEDFLTGGAGDDTIDGGAGFDYIAAGAGSDTLQLRDSGTDRALCGTETDTVSADAADVLKDCESVSLPPIPDTSPPDTTGLTGPKSLKANKPGKFTFGSSELGSTFTCAIDKGPASSCTSPFAVKVKKAGKHTLTVIATDAAGNADPTPATTDFTVKKKKKKKH